MGGEPLTADTLVENLYFHESPEGIPVPNQESLTMMILDVSSEHFRKGKQFFVDLRERIADENPGIAGYIEARSQHVAGFLPPKLAGSTELDMQLLYNLLCYNPKTYKREPEQLKQIRTSGLNRVIDTIQDMYGKEDVYDAAMDRLKLTNNGSYRYIKYMTELAPMQFQPVVQESLFTMYELIRHEHARSNVGTLEYQI